MATERTVAHPYGNPGFDFYSALSGIGDTIAGNRQQSAVNDALTSATGPDGNIDFGSAMAGALKAGDLKTAASLGSMADRQFQQQKDARDFAFRQQESGRTQGNADRAYALQKAQVDASLNGTAVPPGFARSNGPISEGAGGYTGQGPFVTQPGYAPVPGGPQDPAYIEAVTKAKAAETTPQGFRPNDNGLEVIPGGPQDPETIRAQSEAKLGGSIYTDADIERLARQLNAGDVSVLTNVGRGQQGAADIRRIRQRAGELNEEAKLTPEQQALKNAEFQGIKTGQRVLGQQEAKMSTASTELDGAIQQARGLIEKLPRTSFLPFNRLAQGYSTNTLNPDQAELYTRAQAIKNAYAAVMGRGASVTTVHAQQHADELLNTAADPATFNRVLATMKQEADMAVKSPEKVRALYRRQFGDTAIAPPATAPAAAPAIPAPPAGFELVK